MKRRRRVEGIAGMTASVMTCASSNSITVVCLYGEETTLNLKAICKRLVLDREATLVFDISHVGVFFELINHIKQAIRSVKGRGVTDILVVVSQNDHINYQHLLRSFSKIGADVKKSRRKVKQSL